MLRLVVVMLSLGATAFGMPNPDTRFRPGANHHLGNASFVKRFGRLPTEADDEHERMTVHLTEVRGWLASRPATRPELAARRAELLRYLDDYIARGVTPHNTHLPWRSPVFIDDDGAICAVGDLIERSVGRAVAERIAAAHRYDVLEDIAAAMPEVAAWIAGSGFTLDELASIQPSYVSSNVEAWRTWDLHAHPPADGPFDDDTSSGQFARHAMQGTWTVRDAHGLVIGKGDFSDGAGVWHSFYSDGKRALAEGPFVRNVADGPWRLFHASGRLAAEGRFAGGIRVGRWRFHNDTDDGRLIAMGAFGRNGGVVGTWNHYDADGKLLARTRSEGAGERTDLMQTSDGVVRQRHTIDTAPDGPDLYLHSVERLALGADQIYVHTTGYQTSDAERAERADPTVIYDPDGFRLVHTAAGWTAADCHWSRKRIAIAHGGDIAWLDELLLADSTARGVHDHDVVGDPGPSCGLPTAIAATRGHVLDRLLAAQTALHAKPPTFVRDLVLGEDELTEYASKLKPAPGDDSDLLRMLADFTIRYIEWPHIDGQFERVFATMPGRWHWDWAGAMLDHTPSYDPSAPHTTGLRHSPAVE